MDAGLPTEEELALININDLTMEKEIGRGTFGVVHKASYFGADVAVKQFKNPEGGDVVDFEKYLKREIYVQKNARHPNIVQFVGFMKYQGSIALVTQYISGGNLHKYLKDEKNVIPWIVRLKLARDISYAMAFLHSKKILYRDLKAKNAVVEHMPGGGLKGLLCDFGFARSVNNNLSQVAFRHKQGLTICGTDSFMAPEVILGIPYDEKADVYSFGILVLELITRKKIRNIMQRRPQDGFDFDKDEVLRKIPGDCLVQFVQLFYSCCEYRPQLRPSFKDIIVILNNIIDSYKTQQTMTQAPASPTYNSAPSVPDFKNPPTQNKFTELQKVLAAQIDTILQYVNVLSSEPAKIQTEADIMRVKPHLRAIIETKELLNALGDSLPGITYPKAPQMSAYESSKLGLLKQNMSISLLEISMNLRYLKDLIVDGREYQNSVTIGKTIREVKKLLVTLN